MYIDKTPSETSKDGLTITMSRIRRRMVHIATMWATLAEYSSGPDALY